MNIKTSQRAFLSNKKRLKNVLACLFFSFFPPTVLTSKYYAEKKKDLSCDNFIRPLIWGQKGVTKGLWQGTAFLSQIYCLWRACWKVSHLGVHPAVTSYGNKKGQKFPNCLDAAVLFF